MISQEPSEATFLLMYSENDISALLLRCARQGRVNELQQLIGAYREQVKCCVNVLDSCNLNALHYAARNGQFGLVKVLVEEADADVNACGADGATPLHFAARSRRKINESFLENHQSAVDGSSLTQSQSTVRSLIDGDGYRPTTQLHLHDSAVCEPLLGDLIPEHPKTVDCSPVDPVVHYLVEHGARLNGPDANGWTPLHYAAIHGNEVATRQLLMEMSVDTEAIDQCQMRPIHMAAAHGETGIMRQLLAANAELHGRSRRGCLPLHFACSTGNLELVKLLVEASSSMPGISLVKILNMPNVDQETPLHWATANGTAEVVQYCIEKGGNPNMTSRTGETCLHMAARMGNVETVNLLLNTGTVNIDSEDRLLQTALHKATERNNLEALKLLVQRGSNMESEDQNAYTPLLIAASRGHVEAAQTLIEFGANIFAVEKNNKSVVYLCAEENRIELLQVLLRHPQATNLLRVPTIYDDTPLHTASKRGYHQIVKLLVSHGANVSAKNEKDQTPLHYAAKKGRMRIARYLLDKSPALICELDENGNSPIHLAAKYGHRAMMELLLKAGAALDVRNIHRWIPLDCAAANGHRDCVEFLLQNNSPADPTEVSNVTPLHLACKYGHTSVVELLLKWGADPGIRAVGDGDILDNGPNALDTAIENGQNACALLLLQSPSWKRALRNQTINKDNAIETPMRKLIRLMPDLAELVLDRCCELNNSENSGKNEDYDFEFIEDTYANWCKPSISYRSQVTVGTSPVRFLSERWGQLRNRDQLSVLANPKPSLTGTHQTVPQTKVEQPYSEDCNLLKENHPLMLMVKFNQPRLLQHRIVCHLLKRKWSHIGMVYYLNLGLYLLYLTFFSIYMLNTQPIKFVDDMSDKNEIASAQEICRRLSSSKPNAEASTLVLAAKYSILFLALINLSKEVFQLCYNGYRYITLENAMECAIFILGLIVVADFNKCLQRMQLKTSWQWQCGSVGVFLTWLNLLLFLRRIPTLGIFVLMFTVIMRTFAKFFVVFLLFIVAFAFGFYTLLSNHTPFNSLGNSLLKTAVMMLGELEFDSTFNERFTSTERSAVIFYSSVTYTMFVVFLVIMTIVIMNLLVGLAVDDIKGVQNEAVVKRLAMQVELFLDIESLLPHWLRRRWNKAYIAKKTDCTGKSSLKTLSRCGAGFKKHWKSQMGAESPDSSVIEGKAVKHLQRQLEYLKLKSNEVLGGQATIMRTVHALFQILIKMRSKSVDGDEDSSVDSVDREFTVCAQPSAGRPSENAM